MSVEFIRRVRHGPPFEQLQIRRKAGLHTRYHIIVRIKPTQPVACKGCWNTGISSQQAKHGDTPAVAVINDLIYVAGGSGAVGNEVEFYDPAQDAWTTLAPMNVSRNHTAGGAIGGKFYVAGGRPGILAASALEVYDPRTNTWTFLSSMPTGRSGIAAGVVNNRLYVFGGEDPRLFSEVEVYDPATDSWQQVAPESVAAYRGFNSRIGSTAAHHVPDIRARHRPRPEFLRLANRGAEQRPPAVAFDAGSFHVGVEKVFQLVVAGHFSTRETSSALRSATSKGI